VNAEQSGVDENEEVSSREVVIDVASDGFELKSELWSKGSHSGTGLRKGKEERGIK
jgi:hypothetical protein